MNGERQLSVLLIGGGNIAGAFDHACAKDAWPLTHAGAYLRDGRFQLAACVEPDENRRAAFGAHWPVEQLLASVDDIAPDARFDVISICSPTELHAAHLEFSLRMKPRLVFCEKPLLPTFNGATAWVERFDRAGIPLAVNHTRRWAPDLLTLASELRAGQWGRIRSVIGVYNKGILNNGSHLLDLLATLLGELSVEWAGEPVHDHWRDDPSVPAVLRSASGVVASLNIGNAQDFAIFELQILTERGVIAMERGGAGWRIRHAEASAEFNGYRVLSKATEPDGQYAMAMTRAVDNIWSHLASGEPLACTGYQALHAQRLCQQIRQRAMSHRAAPQYHGEPT